MRTLAILITASLAAAAAPAMAQSRPAAGRPDPKVLSAEERDACAADLEVLEKRARLFEQQGLRPSEIAKRNENAQLGLDECVRAWRRQRTAEKERLADIAELERRAGPKATEAQRDEAWAQIRRERLSGKPPSQLTAEERAELHAGTKAEMAETHATLDTVHARDPVFMRVVHSSLACYHGVRKDRLRDELRHEEALVKLGQGDKQKAYGLKSELRVSEEVLARSKEAAKAYPGGLARCTEEKVAILAHCLAARFEGQQAEPACESEEIQQYIRFIK